MEAVQTEIRPHSRKVVDGRSHWARRHRTLLSVLTGELAKIRKLGPRDAIVLRNICGLLISAERQEAAMLAGEPFDPEQHVRSINAANRLATALGLRNANTAPQGASLPEILAHGAP